jgi:integrase/recombinase XerD
MSAALSLIRRDPTLIPADEYVEEWEIYGLASGWSINTVDKRKVALHGLARHAGVPVEEVTGLAFARWLATFTAPATRLTYYKHAKSFFDWLVAAGYRGDNPVEAVKRPRAPAGVPRPVATVDLEAALATPPLLRPRTEAYILLAAYAGLRVHEIAKIRGEDVDLESGALRVFGKGGVDAALPLHPRIVTVADGWPDRGYWFGEPTTLGHVRAQSVSQSIAKRFARVGVTMTAHQLRHWYGTAVLRASGGNLFVAQQLLRHASPATTAIYCRVEDAERSAAVLALP